MEGNVKKALKVSPILPSAYNVIQEIELTYK